MVGLKFVKFDKERIMSDDLERILIESAKDLGFGTRVVNKIREEVDLDSGQTRRDYCGTIINISKFGLPILKVEFDKRPHWFDFFQVYYGIGFGFSTERTADWYLRAVHLRYPVAIEEELAKTS